MTEYEVVNAFTDRPFGGSPLVVVQDATRLSTDAMRAIAEELNIVETSFVLPPSAPEATYQVRVFTPLGEVGSAGHASVGTAATLVRLGAVSAGTVVQECHGVRQLLSADAASATLVGSEPLPATGVDPASACAAIGLSLADVADVAPRSVGFGTRFPMLAVTAAAVDQAEPDFEAMRANGLPALFVFAWDAEECTARARLFAPGFGIDEDPACGPVALALGPFLADVGWIAAPDGTYRYVIHQGRESGRAGVVNCTVTLRAGRPVSGTAAGFVTAVARGCINTPGHLGPESRERRDCAAPSGTSRHP